MYILQACLNNLTEKTVEVTCSTYLPSEKITTRNNYSPFRFPPIFRKHAAPWFRYAGSSEKGTPFKLERNGRSRKTKRACMIHSRIQVNKREKKE
jgi:hypothetical protein